MSMMKAPSKKPKKMRAPKKVNRTKQVKRTKKPPKYPGLTPEDLPEFKPEHRQAFDRMQNACFEGLHRPCKIKIRGWSDSLYYVCKDCLEAYLKENEELKKIVVRFDH